MTPKIAVILFPGTNCELEALRACSRSYMRSDLLRWNEDRKKLKNYDAYIIPGGFSYEDRGRSGVIASKEPIMDAIVHEAKKGKPILGICNGAQILVEKGLIPGLNPEHLEMALAWNERVKKGKILGVGFYNDWIYIKSGASQKRSVFNNFDQNVIMQVPVAHGEGRFTTKESHVLENLIKNEQTLFRYCDMNGNFTPEFPVNPNGAMYNLAGVCNPEGNILALMPHPERTDNGQPIFDSIAHYLKGNKKMLVIKKTALKKPQLIPKKIQKLTKKPEIMITVELIITDNEERTIENTMRKKGFKDLQLKRKIYYGIYAKNNKNLKQMAEKIIKSGEILNLNKEIPAIQIGDKAYRYDKSTGLVEKPSATGQHHDFFTAEYDNYFGKNIQSKLQKYFTPGEIVKVERGILWSVIVKKSEQIEPFVKTHILHNPHSMKIVAIPHV